MSEFSAQRVAVPTLADEYGASTNHRAVVIGTSLSAPPVIAMVGHGAGDDPENKNHVAIFFDVPREPASKSEFPGAENERRLMTNIDLFRFPSYLRGRTPSAYVQELTGGTGLWMGHKIDDTSNVTFSPAGVAFECDNMLTMMGREPVDQEGLTSLIYMNFKAVDLSSHRWGLESLETRDNLRAVDACVDRLIQKLNERVGENNYVVTVTADHGMAPLPELVNGHRILLPRLLELIDERFGGKISLGGGYVNLWFDRAQLLQRRIRSQEIADYLKALTAGEYYGPREEWPTYLPYRPKEKLFFRIYTAEQVETFVKAKPDRWMLNPYVWTKAESSNSAKRYRTDLTFDALP